MDKSLKEYSWGGSGITFNCAYWILKNLEPNKKILEFGAGKISTSFFSKHWNLTTIEQDKNYCNLFDNVNYIHSPIKDDWYDVDLIALPQNYDLIFIDGPVKYQRSKILQKIEHIDYRDSIIVIDDTYREDCRKIVKYFTKKNKNIIHKGDDEKTGQHQFSILK
tara:strand:- start:1705 stop:2196 length:492 start_codon:yes stop_codon:yes gene_type:complete